MKQLNSKKTSFPRFDKILVIQPIAEVYGESNERQLCKEIAYFNDMKPFYAVGLLFLKTIILNEPPSYEHENAQQMHI